MADAMVTCGVCHRPFMLYKGHDCVPGAPDHRDLLIALDGVSETAVNGVGRALSAVSSKLSRKKV